MSSTPSSSTIAPAPPCVTGLDLPQALPARRSLGEGGSPPNESEGPDHPAPTEHALWFKEQVQPHEAALRGYLRAKFPALLDIDDLVQEAYARLLHMRRSDKVSEVRPYLFAIARNAAHDFFRRRKIVQFAELEESVLQTVVEDGPDAAEIVGHGQEIEMLMEAIRALPIRCREAFTLRKLHGFSHRAIAEKLGVSVSTVEGHIATGIFRCRAYLAERGIPPQPMKRRPSKT